MKAATADAYVDAVVRDAVVPESQLCDLGVPAHVLHRAFAPVSFIFMCVKLHFCHTFFLFNKPVK